VELTLTTECNSKRRRVGMHEKGLNLNTFFGEKQCSFLSLLLHPPPSPYSILLHPPHTLSHHASLVDDACVELAWLLVEVPNCSFPLHHKNTELS